MYYFLGRVIALQPDPDAPFVRGEPGHAMLPPGPGAYTLAEPSLLAAAASAAAGGLAAPPAAPPAQGPATPLGANNISPKPAAVGRRGAPAPAPAPGAPAPSLLLGAREPVPTGAGFRCASRGHTGPVMRSAAGWHTCNGRTVHCWHHLSAATAWRLWSMSYDMSCAV